MFKNRMLIVTCIITLTLVAGILGFGIYRDLSNCKEFIDSGYILVAPDNTYSTDDVNTQIYFEKGTTYKKIYPGKIVFRDQKNKKRVLDADSFVHYNNGGVSSLSDAVMVDMNSVDSSVMNYYGLSPDSVMESNGDNFVLDNRGNEMDFQNALWKINDTKYLLLSKNINVKFSKDNERKFKDYIEIDYYDTGIIRIVTSEGTWETVSADCIATLDNGVSLNLYTRTVVQDDQVKLSLKQMVVDSDQNIDIIPQEIKDAANKAPKFDIQTIDGTNGEAGKEGKAGENGKEGDAGDDGVAGDAGTDGTAGTNGQNGINGEAGNPGEPGLTGTTGINGKNGLNGTNGMNGAAGANGQKGEEGSQPLDPGSGSNDDVKVVLPEFSVRDIQAKTNSVKASITVTDQENRLDPSKDFVIEICDNSTGKRIYMTQVDSGNRDFDVEFNGLVADKEYRLVVTAEYIVNNVNYSNAFINKVFMTDSLGMQVDKSYATDSALAFKVTAKDYCQVSEADLQLLDKDNNVLRTIAIQMMMAQQTDGDVLTFSNLTSNTKYKVKLVNIKLNYDENLVALPQVQPGEFMTLKKAPVLGDPVVVTNKRDGNFEFHLESVVDADKAIKDFRYEIYEIGLDSSETLVKTLYNSTNNVIACPVDGTIIKRAYNYRMRVVAECYDNEKDVEYASTYTAVFNMTGDNFPILLFQQDDVQTHHDVITGSLYIDTNGTVLTVDNNNPLRVELKNTKGDTDVLYFKDKPTPSMISNNQYRYTFPISKNNLKASDSYIISVYGTLDLNDGSGARANSLVGNIVTKTDTPNGFKAHLTQDSDLVSPISFRLNLADTAADVSSSYEAGTMEYVEVNLYNGDENAVKNTPPVATLTITGTDADPLKDKLYGANTLSLSANDFGISPSTITSSMYTVEISSVRDYTRYGNQFKVTDNIETFTKQATLPDIHTIDVNNGLLITPITLGNIANYVSASEVANYQKYASDIVFGYEVTAAYFDNSAQLIDSFDYYAFEERDYTTGIATATSSSDFYSKNLQKAVLSKTVQSNGAVPSAVFLFGKNEATSMTRGSRYVFTYRAKMKEADSNGINYFPDTQSLTTYIRSKTLNAPYQQPQFYFYPSISDSDSATWKYYIDSPDPEAVQSSFTVTKGNITGAPKLNIYDSVVNTVEAKITGLKAGDIYSLRLTTSQYKASYGLQVANTLVGQYFEGENTYLTATTSLSYKIEDVTPQNLYRIIVNDTDDNISSLSRVVALKASIYQAGVTSGAPLKTITVPFEFIAKDASGGYGVGYLRYSDIQDLLGNSLSIKITAIYDSGKFGFKDASGAPCAIQLLPTNARGNYLMMNTTNTALMENTAGNAMGSYYTINNIDNQTRTTNVTYTGLIDTTFTGTLNFVNNGNGSRLSNFNGQPLATLKATREVDLHVPNDVNQVFTVVSFTSMTPTISLNRGAAYTIDTTVTSATVHWTLSGQDTLITQNKIRNNEMCFDLYKITDLGTKEFQNRTVKTPIQQGLYKYDTLIDNLASDTKYGVVIYYIDDTTGQKVYPINAYSPEKEASSNVYTFTTSTTIAITPSITAVKYVANSYTDKYLQISYTLNQTLGFNINYSICQKDGAGYKTLLTSQQLSTRGIIQTPLVNKNDMTDERLLISPGKLYWLDDSNHTVYFPFNSTEYYLCVKPVSETNSNVELGNPVYIQLNVTPLNTPFYKIKTVPDTGTVTFQISVLDIGKVMVNGHFRVKVFNGSGVDITPSTYKDKTYVITNPLSVKVTGLNEGEKAELRLYSVYDMLNTGKAANDTVLPDINDVASNDLDVVGANYLKISTTGYPLNDSGYDLGDVQIAQSSSERARIYFTDSVNLDKFKYIRYVVVNDAGVSNNYYELFTLTKVNDSSSYYELSHKFTANGVYQIQVRFYDASQTQLDDLALTYYKSY